MSRTKCLCLLTGAALSLSSIALGQTANLDQSRAYVNELLADASTRTSNLAPADNKFTVNVDGYIQFRYVWNHRDGDDPATGGGFVADDPNGNSNESTIGFQLARTRIDVSGNVISDAWSYFIQFGWDQNGSSVLEDAFGAYNFGNGWSAMWGQFKAPFTREELVGDTKQLCIDRSVTGFELTLGRTQGVEFVYESKDLKAYLSVNDGGNAANTDFNSTGEADFGATARVEFKWAGDFKQAVDFTSFQQSPYFGMVGGAVHYQTGGSTWGTADVDAWGITGDVSIEGNGWNGFGAVVLRHIDPNTGAAPSLDDWGVVLQGGIFLNPTWELFGRYDILIPDEDNGAASDDNFSTISVGLNDYFSPNSHAAKFTVQLSWFLDKQDAGIASANTLTTLLPATKDSQWSLSAQMQIEF